MLIAPDAGRRLATTSFKAGVFEQKMFEETLCQYLKLDVPGGEFVTVTSIVPDDDYDNNNIVILVIEVGTNSKDSAVAAQSMLTSPAMMGELDNAFSAAGLSYEVHGTAKLMASPPPSPEDPSASGGVSSSAGVESGGGEASGSGVSGASKVQVDDAEGGTSSVVIIASVVAIVVAALLAVGAWCIWRRLKTRNGFALTKPFAMPKFVGGAMAASSELHDTSNPASVDQGGSSELDNVVIR